MLNEPEDLKLWHFVFRRNPNPVFRAPGKALTPNPKTNGQVCGSSGITIPVSLIEPERVLITLLHDFDCSVDRRGPLTL